MDKDLFELQIWLKEKCNQCFTVEDLSNLEYLNISALEIKEIPKTIGSLKKLKFLFCSHNEIKILNIKLPNLELLNCDSNLIEDLKLDCPNLKTLDCSNNRITSLFLENQQLYYIIAHSNLISEFNFKCPDLAHLEISKNEIQTFFLSSDTIVFLDCSKNKINQLALHCKNLVNILCYNSTSFFLELNCNHSTLFCVDEDESIISVRKDDLQTISILQKAKVKNYKILEDTIITKLL